LQAAKGEKAKFFAPGASLAVVVGMTRTATSGQFRAILAKRPPANLQRFARAAALARGGFGGLVFRRQTHALEKFSASATAFRIAMDLLTVS
jgi:hypothetical protein